MPGRTGRLHFTTEPHAVFRPRWPPGLHAEQSNTSVVCSDAFILKLFRRVSPGAIPTWNCRSRWRGRLATGRRAGGVVRVAGARSGPAAEEPTTLGVLQRFLPGSSDGWALALASVAEDGDFRAEAAALGRATAEVHACSPPRCR